MGDAYFFFKALHLVAMVAWFAGLFYIFRLFVYHVENAEKPEVTSVLKVMAKRLYKIIIVPAMLATFVCGIAMIVLNPSLMKQPWLHAKLTLVILLAGYTGFCGSTRRKFANDQINLSSRACRLWNEVPTVFLIVIVFLAVFRHYMMGSGA